MRPQPRVIAPLRVSSHAYTWGNTLICPPKGDIAAARGVFGMVTAPAAVLT